MLLSLIVYVAIALTQARIEVGPINWVSMLAAPSVAAVAMAVPLLLLSGVWPVAIAVGVSVYVAAYVAVDRVVDPDDMQFVIDLVTRRLRPRGRKTEPSAV
jgi:hypothetical protein